MKNQRGVIGWILAAIVVLLIGFGACLAAAGDEEDGYVPIQLVDHDGCWEGDCGGGEYDQWNQDDRNRNRNRNRGAFSPGPFEDSPVDFRDNCISLDCGGREPSEDRREEEMR